MRAWVVRGEGNPWDVFQQEDFPEPTHEDMTRYAIDIQGLRPKKAGDRPFTDYVFVRVLVAGLAFPDVTMATGKYPVPVLRPYVSGQECVGVVEDASPSMQQWLGKRVVGFTPQPYGCFAEKCVGMSPVLYEAPETFSDEEAAGFVIASHTAHHVVYRRGKVTSGETVLVLGAAGGVPSSALQLCRAAGARVVAVVGGVEKADFVRELGAEVVIDHQAEDFVEAVRREVGEVDAIVDFVQGEPGALARRLLRVEGRHIMAGHAGGLLPVHPNEFYLQNWTLIGCCMGAGYAPEEQPGMEQEAHDDILELIRKGQYRTPVSRVIDFGEIPDAFHDMVNRKAMGRIVARIAGQAS